MRRKILLISITLVSDISLAICFNAASNGTSSFQVIITFAVLHCFNQDRDQGGISSSLWFFKSTPCPSWQFHHTERWATVSRFGINIERYPIIVHRFYLHVITCIQLLRRAIFVTTRAGSSLRELDYAKVWFAGPNTYHVYRSSTVLDDADFNVVPR